MPSFNYFWTSCVIFWTIFALQCDSVKQYDSSVMNFVIDTVKYNRKFSPPYKIVGFFSWSQETVVNLVKKLSQEHIMASIFSTDEQWSLSEFVDNTEFIMFLLDMRCEYSKQLLIQANASKLLNPPNRWFLLSTQKDYLHNFEDPQNYPVNFSIDITTVTSPNRFSKEPQTFLSDDWAKLLSSLNVHVSTEMLIGVQDDDGCFILVDVYKRHRTMDVDLNILASWNESSGITWLSDIAVARRRQNLQGIPMRVATVILDNSTREHMTDLVNTHIDSLTRVSHFLVTHALEQMNCSMKIFYVTSWGYLVNGTWNGVVGHLIRDEADIAGTAFLLVQERTQIIQYLMMTVPSRIAFVFRQPPLSYTSNVFSLPFSRAVWCSIVALLAVCGFLLYHAFKWETIHIDDLNDSHVDKYLRSVGAEHQITWSDVVMFVMGAVTEQGSTFEPNKLSGRILSIFLFIFVIFMITSYSASIVVLLQSSTNSIQTLKDLLDSGLELASHDTVYNRYFIKRVNDSLRRTIYQKRIAPKGSKPKFYSLQKGIEKMRKGRFAFHFELGVGFKLISETYLENEKCGLKTITYLPVVDTYQVIQKHSPYKEIISIVFHKMIERGILRRAYNRYYTKKPECTTDGSNFVEVGLTEFYPALLVLLYGIISSVIILLLEILIYKRSNSYIKH